MERERLTPEDIDNVTFAKPPLPRLGYHEDEVDAFLEVVKAALQHPAGHGLAPEQVRDVAFAKARPGRRGYDEREVDAFLDVVEAQLRSRQAALPRPLPLSVAAPSVRASARHGRARHAAPETPVRRVFNLVAGFLVWVLEEPDV